MKPKITKEWVDTYKKLIVGENISDKQAPNKQKTDWERKLMTLMVITVADALFAGRSRPITKDCSDVTVKHHKKISKFISRLLLTQRQQLISEIEGIVGEYEKLKYGRAGAVGKTIRECELFHYGEKAGRNQLRKEIKERLKQIY